MANNYFRFKQFTIYQDKCSMKVCTDACIFGAWLANYSLAAATCLDIGTGTGLLSLMYAQQNLTATIDAVEIEENAFEQAKENFQHSRWSDRLQVFKADIKEFKPGKKYDLIISNPPFYENDLLSTQKNKNIAKHDAGLNFSDLIKAVRNNLKDDGNFAVLLPYQRIEYFEKLAGEHNFFVKEKLLIKQSSKHNFFRGILVFSNLHSSYTIKELIIKTDNDEYTVEFKELLKNYYLNF